MTRVIVVGGGIVGASFALHLARRGAAATVLDKGAEHGASARAFGWITVAHGQPESHHRLRREALGEWRRLESELAGRLTIDWSGALRWARDPAETERFVAEHVARGYDVRLLSARDVVERAPALVAPPPCAAFAPGEGMLEPPIAVSALLAAAQDAGAELRAGVAVDALETQGGRVIGVRAGDARLEADHVVLAAGTGAPELLTPLGVALPVEASPALLLRYRADRRLVEPVVCGPEFEIRQPRQDALIACEDFESDWPASKAEEIGRQALAAIRDGLRGAETLSLVSAQVGVRPIPTNEMPMVGRFAALEGLYVATMHAGVTLAAAIGRHAAAEILDGAEVAALADCRPDRALRRAAAAPDLSSAPDAPPAP